MAPVVVKIIIAALALVIGALIGYIYRKNVGEKAIGSAEQKARNLILDAENRSETMKKEAILEAKEEAHRLRSEAERDARDERKYNGQNAGSSRKKSLLTGNLKTSKRKKKV